MMKVKVVPIGNSRGIRIPKAVLDQCAITEAVDLRLDGRSIVLTPLKSKPRQGWDAAAEQMRLAGDDELLIPDVFPDDAEDAW
jgi:antitoxin MazE